MTFFLMDIDRVFKVCWISTNRYWIVFSSPSTMAFTPSIAIFCLIIIVSSVAAIESQTSADEIVHDGMCELKRNDC